MPRPRPGPSPRASRRALADATGPSVSVLMGPSSALSSSSAVWSTAAMALAACARRRRASKLKSMIPRRICYRTRSTGSLSSRRRARPARSAARTVPRPRPMLVEPRIVAGLHAPDRASPPPGRLKLVAAQFLVGKARCRDGVEVVAPQALGDRVVLWGRRWLCRGFGLRLAMVDSFLCASSVRHSGPTALFPARIVA